MIQDFSSLSLFIGSEKLGNSSILQKLVAISETPYGVIPYIHEIILRLTIHLLNAL